MQPAINIMSTFIHNEPTSLSILQELKPQPDAAPPKGDTILRTQPAPGAGLPLTAPFDIKLINITGNTRFDTPTLHALVRPVEGTRLTLGQLTSFTMYLGFLIWPMFAYGWLLNILERGSAAYARIQQLLEMPSTVPDTGTLTDIPSADIAIDIDEFTFALADYRSQNH